MSARRAKDILRWTHRCWDTDCNGATAGSIVGAMYGTAGVGPAWYEVFQDTVWSAVFGYSDARISELANRTWQIARHNRH